MIKLGMLDFDTSHVVEFAKRINHEGIAKDQWVEGARIVIGCPGESLIMPERIPGYKKEIEKFGIPLVDRPEDMIGKVWKGKWRGQRQIWFLYRFLGEDSDIRIDTEHPEFRAWRWAEPDTLPAMIVPFKKALYEELLVVFAAHFTAGHGARAVSAEPPKA